ncbi:hypothetical protein K4039_17625 [Lyngbya sp. CCAP 1446/10]|nr:hypothetical protein [Lyngbya sp. CCAP 1446/10]
MASATAEICQNLGTDKGDGEADGQLFQPHSSLMHEHWLDGRSTYLQNFTYKKKQPHRPHSKGFKHSHKKNLEISQKKS